MVTLCPQVILKALQVFDKNRDLQCKGLSTPSIAGERFLHFDRSNQALFRQILTVNRRSPAVDQGAESVYKTIHHNRKNRSAFFI